MGKRRHGRVTSITVKIAPLLLSALFDDFEAGQFAQILKNIFLIPSSLWHPDQRSVFARFSQLSKIDDQSKRFI